MQESNAPAAVLYSYHNIIWYHLVAKLECIYLEWQYFFVSQADLAQLASVVTAINDLGLPPAFSERCYRYLPVAKKIRLYLADFLFGRNCHCITRRWD